MKTLRFVWLALLISMAGVASVSAQKQPQDLTQLDLASLMQMDLEVTTASKSAQSIYEIPAPIYVITAEDMRRAGSTSIPEALRMAPGVMVGQIDPGKWVVSLRGFGWQYANKALVLLDGRAVYSPVSSNVYWDSLDVPIEDIDRIEVIRGPGDARWGSHAVNGIVNIITKSSADTHGTLLSAVMDTDGSEILTARYGAAASATLNYRAYAKYLSQGDFPMSSGDPRLGDRKALRAGLRLDGTILGGDRISFIGDVQSGRDSTALAVSTSPPPTRYDTDEWSALTRWERGSPGHLNQHVQLSFDRTNQEIYEERDTFDFAYQAQLPEFHAQTWTFGAVYKRSEDVLVASINIIPLRMTQNIYGLFVHDRIALGAKSRLLLGSQFERNPFSGWEIQPNIQLLYTPAEGRSYWASVSRAVRTPLRTETGFNLDIPVLPGIVSRVQGDPGVRVENVLAWQAGVRMMIRDDLFLDLSAFYNHYKDLVLVQGRAPFFEPTPPPGNLVVPLAFTNLLSGDTKGIEAVLRARPLARWNLDAGYSLYSQPPWSDSLWFGSVTAVEHQFQIHSSASLAAGLEWNLGLYYTSRLTSGDVPDYYKLDTQLAWTPFKGLQLAIGVKNALDSRHREAGANSPDSAAQIPRTGYLQVQQRF